MDMSNRHIRHTLGAIAVGAAALAACDSIDCTLYNTVSLACSFYSEGQAVKLTDTLTVSALGTDSILVNSLIGASKLELPLSYSQDADTLVLRIYGKEYDLSDTLWVEKTNTPHFESPDCPTTMFHQIKSVRHTSTFIDSVTITRNLVDYDQTENIRIHL